MGCDDWLQRRVAPIEPIFDLADFPDHNFCDVRCEACGKEYHGIFKPTQTSVTCPTCHVVGAVTIVRIVKRIYLQ